MTEPPPTPFAAVNRWTQVTFTEDDPATFDVAEWVDIMRRTQSRGVCLSAGGYVAYYPTAVPYHHRSAALGDRDLFGEMVEAARSAGLRVMARIDPHAVHADAAAANPDWLARDAQDRLLEHTSIPDVWFTCPFGPYHREVVPEILREVLGSYDVEAVFLNRWESPGLSYSRAAQDGFRRASGLELPAVVDPAQPAWAPFVAWRRRQLSDLVIRWNDVARAVRSDSHVFPSASEMFARDLEDEIAQLYCPAFFVDRQGRIGRQGVWAAGQVGKRSRGVHPDRPITLITSVGPETPHRWKDSVKSPVELRTWIVDGFVHGAMPWFTKFSGSIRDTRWVAPVAEAFGMHAKVEDAYAASTPVADIAILEGALPDPSHGLQEYLASRAVEDGYYQALLEARLPFEYLAATALTPERLAPFRVVVVPGTSHLTKQACAALAGFVERGGALLVDHGTAAPGPASSALDGVLGTRRTGPTRTDLRNTYAAFDAEHADHPVSAGFEGATRIIAGTRAAPLEAADGADVLLRFVPSYPELPMEEVYPRGPAVDPAVVAHRYGAGRTVTVAFDLGAVHWEYMLADHQRLIENTVRWLLGPDGRAEVAGEGLVDLALRESAAQSVLSLVNLDGAHALRGELRKLPTLSTQRVSLRAPTGASGAEVRRVVRGDVVTVPLHQGRIVVDVDEVEHLECLVVTWATGP